MKSYWLALSALVAVTAVGSAEARPRHARVEGSITAVSSATTPQTVTIDGVTLNVVPSTKIHVGEDGERGTIADLVVGLDAEAKYDRNTLNARQIKVEEDPNQDEAQGRVTAVIGNQLLIDTNNDTVGDLTVVVDASTQVKLNGILLSADELGLLTGLTVRTEFNTSTVPALATLVAAEVNVQTVVGTVQAVDAVAGTLTILTANNQTLTFSVVDNALVKIGNETVELADVLVGDVVSVVYFQDSTSALVALGVRVAVQQRHVVGVITDVDAAAGTITVQPRNGGTPIVLTVGADSEIRVNGKVRTLAQLETAIDAGQRLTVSASYVTRGTINQAVKVQVNANGRGRGRG